MAVVVACVLFAVSAAFQVSDSKLERNIWASLPGAIPLPCSSASAMTVPKPPAGL